ncbi:MAG: hypothetical protein ACRDD1_05580 [Planctomycetia bacterium]
MTVEELEQRLRKLEREFEEFRAVANTDPPRNAWRETIGAFDDYPDFAEIVRLGAEYRKSQKPDDEAC